ncbi:MAG: hypothetical protein AAF828_10885 [Bacteroidota bacterium]
MNFFSKLGFTAAAFLTVLALLALRPVPIEALSECETIQGIVTKVTVNANQDLVLTLDKTNRVFYINRGAERGFELEVVKDVLLQQDVTLYYPKYWTPLDPTASIRHLSGIKLGDQMFFSEAAGARR